MRDIVINDNMIPYPVLLTIVYPDYNVELDYCICFDEFRRKFFSSKNYDINISTAASIAEKIAAMGDVAA